eukprot:TRINITY_DN1089_c0_g1_i1.p1 TRINITY_DN1089_c0_g1~~TRINITY_DN1089_c0_g1_i1.p1  ORF type:complete len:565 (+),score=114.50 TRINITY_DN1089_c0_g1_i1:152-1846(+)
MADIKSVVTDIESTASMIEQLGKTFTELESHRDASPDYGVQWKEIEEHFQNLAKSLKERFDELEAKEKAFMEKESESRALLAERESAVVAKEQASLDRVQEIKDAAVSAIVEARQKCKVASDVGANTESKVNSREPNAPNSEEKSPDRSGEPAEAVADKVKPRPQLKQFCEQMDVKGLLKFISENRKNLAAIREEIPVALESATDPARLVLDSLEGFYLPDQTTSPHEGNKKDSGLLAGLRRSCIMLMESVAPLLVGSPELGVDHPLSSEIKQQAKAIADEWQPKLASADGDGNSLEAQAFLRLLATFNIASEFEEDELCKLILAVSRRRQTPELCRSLGLTHKMPGVIESLVNLGKLLDAVHFVQAFQLAENFPPVPLLKTYLKDLRRNSQGKGGNAGTVGDQNNANTQELSALRAVIRCIEEYKFEAEYPLDPLQKRVAQLEKAQAIKKRMAEPGKPQPKRPKAIGGYVAPRVSVAAADRQPPPSVFSDRGLHLGGSERYPYTNLSAYNYELPSQSLFSQQGSVQRSYYYPDERVPATTSSYSATYGDYLGSGLKSTHQPYM